MPELDNPKHEVFCHAVARGNSPVSAYVGAGYPRDPDAAEALTRTPRIKARIAELMPHYDNLYRSGRLSGRNQREAAKHAST